MTRCLAEVAILIAVGNVDSVRGQSTAFVSVAEVRNTGANEWRSIGPAGGPIAALSVDPHSGAVFAATWNGASFQSADRAASWVPSGAPDGVLIFDPADARTIYGLALSGAPSKSVDGE